MKKKNYLGRSISLCASLLSKIIFFSAFCIFLYTPFSVWSQTRQIYKTLSNANAFVNNGKVVITAFKANRYSSAEDKNQFRNIRIYRLSCPDFVFGTDYEEYFGDLDYKKSELIFKGSIEPLLDSKFSYTDTTVKTGSVYAYWIASSEGEPVGPLPVKVRNMDAWWSYEKVINDIENLKDKYPKHVIVENIGYSVNRKPIFGIKVGQGKPCIALIGAIHAGESGPELIIPILEKLLIQSPEILNRISVIAVPSVNCDQRNKLVRGNPWYLRRNANFVDLNRNFPADWENVDLTYGYKTTDPDGLTYRGPFAASEPETIAVMNFLKSSKPRVVFSFHCLASICGEELVASNISAKNKKYVDQCSKYAKLYWEGVDPQLPKSQQIDFGCNSGSLPTWCYKELGIPAFDMEAPIDMKDRTKCVNDSTDIVLLEKYREKHLKGFIKLLKTL